MRSNAGDEVAAVANYLRQLQGNTEALLSDAELLFVRQR